VGRPHRGREHRGQRSSRCPTTRTPAETFQTTFSILQQAIIIGGPDDADQSALLRYALGKNPKIARDLAAITDPVKFTIAMVRTMDKIKASPRKTAPAPETVPRARMAGVAAVDNQLAKLEAEADKTGDRTKVAKYLRAKQQAA
jgi:hypothetical protein